LVIAAIGVLFYCIVCVYQGEAGYLIPIGSISGHPEVDWGQLAVTLISPGKETLVEPDMALASPVMMFPILCASDSHLLTEAQYIRHLPGLVHPEQSAPSPGSYLDLGFDKRCIKV